MSGIFIENTTLIKSLNPVQILKDTSILIENGRVASLNPPEKVPEQVRIIDGRGSLVLPGFINAHHHFYSSFARGITGLAPSADFKEILHNLWWKLDRSLTEEACYFSALTSCIECIKSGTTTVIDHHSAPFAMDLRHLARAVRETGIRSCLCYEVSDRDGKEITRKALDTNVAFLNQIEENPDPLLRGLFGVHASFTVGKETLESISHLCEQTRTGIHIHLAEDLMDQEDSLSRYGYRVVHRLNRAGLLNHRTLLAHGVHLNDEELRLIASKEAFLVHNAQSNMNNAVGAADLSAWEKHGVQYGLGTDAMTTDMRQELRTAIWMQKHRAANPSAGFDTPLKALLQGNHLLAQKLWDQDFSTLSPGKPADLIMLKYDPITPLDESNFAGHLVFGMAQAPVTMSVVNGKLLMENGTIEGLDEEYIARESRKTAEKLWDAMT